MDSRASLTRPPCLSLDRLSLAWLDKDCVLIYTQMEIAKLHQVCDLQRSAAHDVLREKLSTNDQRASLAILVITFYCSFVSGGRHAHYLLEIPHHHQDRTVPFLLRLYKSPHTKMRTKSKIMSRKWLFILNPRMALFFGRLRPCKSCSTSSFRSGTVGGKAIYITGTETA